MNAFANNLPRKHLYYEGKDSISVHAVLGFLQIFCHQNQWYGKAYLLTCLNVINNRVKNLAISNLLSVYVSSFQSIYMFD